MIDVIQFQCNNYLRDGDLFSEVENPQSHEKNRWLLIEETSRRSIE